MMDSSTLTYILAKSIVKRCAYSSTEIPVFNTNNVDADLIAIFCDISPKFVQVLFMGS